MARTRPHVKVHISVADHPKTIEVWADLAMRGMLVELWRKAAEKFAGKTDDRVQLKPTDRMDIAGTTDQARADQGVTELCARVGYELRKYHNRWVVKVRKFAKKQGWEVEELQHKLADVGQELPPPNPNPNPNPNNVGGENAPSAPESPAAPRSSRRTLIDKPESFPDESKARLVAWADRKGFDRAAMNAGLDLFRDWTPLKPPYRRTIEQWEGAFKKILRESIADGKIGKSESKMKPTYRRDDSGQVLVPNEWRGIA